MTTKLLALSTILLIVGLVFVTTSHKHSDDCKWIPPLQTQYVMCDDGKVRSK